MTAPDSRTDGSSTRRLWPLLFAAALLVQCLILYWPSPPDSLPDGPDGLDKVVHLLVFAVPAALGVLAGLRRWIVVVVFGLQAAASELIQGWLLADRGADPWDFLADLFGIALGLLVADVVQRWRQRHDLSTTSAG